VEGLVGEGRECGGWGYTHTDRERRRRRGERRGF
jgi:hypothetical protein